MLNSCDTLSRLKGIETKGLLEDYGCLLVLRYAFPVEGNGNPSKRGNPLTQITCDTLSRSKGMETFAPAAVSSYASRLAIRFPGRRESKQGGCPGIYPGSRTCDTLSRWKGIETYPPNHYACKSQNLRYAFPFEGNGNMETLDSENQTTILAIRFPV